MKTYNIELDNDIRIFGLIECGCGFTSDGEYIIKGNMWDVLNLIKSNPKEALLHNNFEIDFSASGSFGKNTICFPFASICMITNNDNEILYDKYE